jgi:predicted MPP superfamily phosphohydrolase
MRNLGERSGVWLRRWLIALNVGLLIAGALIGMWMSRRGIYLALFVPIVFVPFAYARVRVHRQLASFVGPRLMVGVLAAGIGLDLAMTGQLLTGRSPSVAPWLHGPLSGWIGPVWFSAHALAFLGYGLLGLARLAARSGARVASWWRRPAPAAADGELLMGRRQVLQQFGIVGAAAPFAVSLSGVPLSYDFRVEERDIELPGWPRRLDGMRIAHLSDIHVGGSMDRARLQRVAALTNAARPDLVLHTGDFLTHRSGDFDAPLYDALAAIEAPHGQYACLGNHDYDDVARFTARLRAAGVTALRDQLAVLDIDGQRLEIAGLDYTFDRGRRAERYARVLGGTLAPRSGAPRLLLNHDPSAFADLPEGCADLVLSGHTHGGHIGVQLGRDRALTVVGLVGMPDQGIFRRGDMRLFVTRCVGFYGYPMRVGIPPEIAILVLRAPGRGAGV